MIRTICVSTSLVAAALLPLAAQQPPADVLAFSPMNIEFMSGPVAFESQPITGAPYSAEAVTEVTQALVDGNRIVRQNTAQISRDSRGRTRREQGLGTFGPLVNGGSEARHVQISDPEAKTTTMLDLQQRIAHRMPVPNLRLANRMAIAGGAGVTNVREGNVAIEKFEIALPPVGAPGEPAVQVFSARRMVAGEKVPEPLVEQLGPQFMEGLTVEGTRTTVTIPAGQIGNERPILIVSERWYSPELQVLVMSRQSDPRFGETTYRLTNIVRVEPPAELFEVPPDFRVVAPPAMGPR